MIIFRLDFVLRFKELNAAFRRMSRQQLSSCASFVGSCVWKNISRFCELCETTRRASASKSELFRKHFFCVIQSKNCEKRENCICAFGSESRQLSLGALNDSLRQVTVFVVARLCWATKQRSPRQASNQYKKSKVGKKAKKKRNFTNASCEFSLHDCGPNNAHAAASH